MIKITLHLDIETVEDQMSLKTGDIVWLSYSERPFFLEASMPRDAIEDILSSVVDKMANQYADKGRTMESEEISTNFVMEKLMSTYKLSYKKIIGGEEDSIEASVLKPEGLFKIESSNPLYGERVCWQTNFYRFKHLISGRYLSLGGENLENKLNLEKEPSLYSLFMFFQVQTTHKNDLANRYVKRDSYYKLKSFYQSWVRLPIHRFQDKNSTKESQEVIFDLTTSTHIDTLRVNTCNPDEAREKPFLLSTYPIIIEVLIALGELNSQMKAYLFIKSALLAKERAVSISYTKFDQAYSKTENCLRHLADYLLNKSPSNISTSDEFGNVSAARQKVLVDIRISKMLIILIENLFPFLEDISDAKRNEIITYSSMETGTFNLLSRPVHEKLEMTNYFRRSKLMGLAYEVIKLICCNNPPIQLANSIYLMKLTQGLILVPQAIDCLRELVKNNDDILMEYCKIKPGVAATSDYSPRSPNSGSPKSVGSNSPRSIHSFSNHIHAMSMPMTEKSKMREQGSFGFEFFEEIARRMKLYPLYSQEDMLQLLASLCRTQDRSFYLNQNNVFEVVLSPNVALDHLLNTKLVSSSQDLSVVYYTKNHQQKIILLKELANQQGLDQHRTFFKIQLSFFADLCSHHNTITSGFFKDKFPMTLLVKYVEDHEFPDDFKAVFLKLMLSIYIDSSTRRELELPMLIRQAAHYSEDSTAKYVQSISQTKVNKEQIKIEILPEAKGHNHMNNKILNSSKHRLLDYSFPEENLKILPRMSEKKQETILISQLRTGIIEALETRAKTLREPKFRLSSFYNDYTLEMLRVLCKMIRFNCYDVTACYSDIWD